ncbi:hypothetical protein [Micromonospora cremea]|uniref:hypothetical protein n=1 Tax=Micromonospora cremea TaxID=709881 RepID=UPI00135649B7|nr:hypothetical protein [Micromonospora cremea]
MAYLGVLLLLAGCGLGEALSAGDGQRTWVDLTPAALIGMWRSDRGDTIEFTADGEFFGDDVKYMFADSDLASNLDLSQDRATGSGRWHLTTPLGNPNGKHAFVGLSFDVVANQPSRVEIDKLLARRNDDSIELGYNVGDPDLNDVVSYLRCDNSCPHVAPSRPSLGVPTAAGRGQLIGVWRDQHGARLALNADGSYTAEDLRFAYVGAEKLLPYGISLEGALSSEGTWSMKPPPHDPFGPATTTVLAIGKIAGKPSFGTRPLGIYADGQDLVLATFSSNPEVIEQHTFRRIR